MAGKIIPLRLDLSVGWERRLKEKYDAMPKYRRMEFLRRLLERGLAAEARGGVAGAPATAADSTPTRARRAADKHKDKDRASATNSEPSAGRAAGATRTPAGSVKGFFGEVPAANP